MFFKYFCRPPKEIQRFFVMNMHIGSHVNKHKDGWLESFEVVRGFGGNTSQIFVSSPIGKMSDASFREYKAKGDDIRSYLKQSGHKVFIHSAYTLNFAKDPIAEKPYWIDAMMKELTIADCIGAEGCVLHMGKAVALSQSQAEDNMYVNVVTLLDRMKSANINATLFLETSAGQGTEILATRDNDLTSLAKFFKRFDRRYHTHLKFCVDTCHIFAAGYDISDKAKVAAFFEDWDARIGLQHMGLIHFNNSVHELSSGKDRHASIQYGKIPVEGLVAFAITAMKHGIPLVLETPTGPPEIVVLKEIENMMKGTSTSITLTSPSMVKFPVETDAPRKKVVKKKVIKA